MGKEEKFKEYVRAVYHMMLLVYSLIAIVGGVLIYAMIDPDFSAFKNDDSETYVAVEEIDEDLIENGIHVRTGFIDAEGLMTVINNCTNCHSSKLVTQNRMSKERWNATIRWMQETQNLWDLGNNQEIIVNYLVTNYPVEDKGRRASLTNIEWYELED
ncbi:monoheme cytochrome C [Dokdonia ponticola]|uniref:Monoheme cytochrome C n=1 Tax=Dokdonia ponticola TaxID=2041041 RepID=A0ABV9HTF8_9FLAO